MAYRKVYRSTDNKIIAGVCGGIAEYFESDAWLIRIIFLISAFFGAAGIILYVILWVILPEKNMENNHEHVHEHDHEHHGQPPWHRHSARGRAFFGIILVILGAILLLNNLFPNFEIAKYWPVLIVLAGAAIMLRE